MWEYSVCFINLIIARWVRDWLILFLSLRWVTKGPMWHVVRPVGVSCISERTSSAYVQTRERKKENAYYNVFSNLGGIGYSILVPSPLALISFVILILIAVIWSSVGSVFYHRYLLRKRLCWKYLSL